MKDGVILNNVVNNIFALTWSCVHFKGHVYDSLSMLEGVLVM